MSDGVRGRALIINVCSVKKGNQYTARVGSHVDYENVSNLFGQLGFDIVKRGQLPAHLTAQVPLSCVSVFSLGKIHIYERLSNN